jgi:hypothetical protein
VTFELFSLFGFPLGPHIAGKIRLAVEVKQSHPRKTMVVPLDPALLPSMAGISTESFLILLVKG